jgi:hypothetical protein
MIEIEDTMRLLIGASVRCAGCQFHDYESTWHLCMYRHGPIRTPAILQHYPETPQWCCLSSMTVAHA